MATDRLTSRVNRLETLVPAARCLGCARRPVIDLSGSVESCPACGRAPFVFTIDIDRAGGRGDADAA